MEYILFVIVQFLTKSRELWFQNQINIEIFITCQDKKNLLFFINVWILF